MLGRILQLPWKELCSGWDGSILLCSSSLSTVEERVLGKRWRGKCGDSHGGYHISMNVAINHWGARSYGGAMSDCDWQGGRQLHQQQGSSSY